MLASRWLGARRLLCGELHEKVGEFGHSSRSVNVRHKSGGSSRRRRNRRGDLIELQVESGELEAIALKRLEETIHHMAVKRAAPAWLPFLPGMSYFVPPPVKLGEVIDIVINSQPNEEDLQAFSTARRGWPSPAYYIGDESSPTPEAIPEKNGSSEEEEEG